MTNPRIPDEVLYRIFLRLVIGDYDDSCVEPLEDAEDDEDVHSRASKRNMFSPWNIAAVCASWRRVCLDAPRIWSYITFGWHNCDNRYSSGFLLRTYSHLARSKTVPLHVNAYIPTSCSCECLSSALTAIAAQCHRWRKFRFNCANYYDVDTYIQQLLCDVQCSQLQFIDLRCSRTARARLPFNGSSQLVNLRSARLNSFTYRDWQVELPWNQLTHLYLVSTEWYIDDLLSVLSHCENITHFQFHDGYCFRARQDINAVTLPHLVSLDLYDTNAIDKANLKTMCRFLPHITTPKLCNIKYGILNSESDLILSSLFERSACTLTTLDICCMGGGDWVLFQGQPQLECLTIRDYVLTDDEDIDLYEGEISDCDHFLLWKLLVVDSESRSSKVVLPRLRHLALHGHEFDPALLIRVVESRKVPALQSLLISFSSQFTGEQIKFYKTVLEECLGGVNGLDLCVKTPTNSGEVHLCSGIE